LTIHNQLKIIDFLNRLNQSKYFKVLNLNKLFQYCAKIKLSPTNKKTKFCAIKIIVYIVNLYFLFNFSIDSPKRSIIINLKGPDTPE